MTERVEIQAPPNFANSRLNGSQAEVLRVAGGVTTVRLLDGESEGMEWQLLSQHVRPIHREPTPESEPVTEVVWRLEAAIPHAVNHDLLRCALTEIRNLQAENEEVKRLAHDMGRDGLVLSDEVDRLQATNEQQRKQNERLKRALREYGRVENWTLPGLRGPEWAPAGRLGIPAWEDPTHIANLALGRRPG